MSQAYGEMEVVEAVELFCRLIGCDLDFTVGFTAEPGRLVVCMFLRDGDNPDIKKLDENGIPMVGDFTADFGTGEPLAFVEGSGRPITDLIDIENSDPAQ